MHNMSSNKPHTCMDALNNRYRIPVAYVRQPLMVIHPLQGGAESCGHFTNKDSFRRCFSIPALCLYMCRMYIWHVHVAVFS